MTTRKSVPRQTAAAEKLALLLHEHGMTQRGLCRLWRVSPAYVSDLVSGRRLFSARVALRLEATFGEPAEAWMDLERDRELYRESLLMEPELDRIRRESSP